MQTHFDQAGKLIRRLNCLVRPLLLVFEVLDNLFERRALLFRLLLERPLDRVDLLLEASAVLRLVDLRALTNRSRLLDPFLVARPTKSQRDRA